jgi:hypothetical protein
VAADARQAPPARPVRAAEPERTEIRKPGTPEIRRTERFDVQITEEQRDWVDATVRRLNRERGAGRAKRGEPIRQSEIARVALALLRAHEDALHGLTEEDLLAAVLRAVRR